MKLNLKYYNSQKIKKLLKLKDIVFISCLNFENNKKRLVIEQFFKNNCSQNTSSKSLLTRNIIKNSIYSYNKNIFYGNISFFYFLKNTLQSLKNFQIMTKKFILLSVKFENKIYLHNQVYKMSSLVYKDNIKILVKNFMGLIKIFPISLEKRLKISK